MSMYFTEHMKVKILGSRARTRCMLGETTEQSRAAVHERDKIPEHKLGET